MSLSYEADHKNKLVIIIIVYCHFWLMLMIFSSKGNWSNNERRCKSFLL